MDKSLTIISGSYFRDGDLIRIASQHVGLITTSVAGIPPKEKSTLYYAIPLLTGLTVTHTLIPSTSGPMVVAGILGSIRMGDPIWRDY
ncbi:MAG TPA: GntP family permease [Parabacteroides merdae]|uniref:hypothetical protein n=1 Tax=Bacteroidales TaxID=171549 RepID=UPI001897F2F4|nr:MULTISPECIES: hypothetical protein [Bacteroidales]MBS4867668.1 hypothetical protein [Parabacteroides merdae]HJG26492.1 GntP family permease [Parabacteroides merdae]